MSRSCRPPDIVSRDALEKTMMHLNRRELDEEDFRISEAACRTVLWMADELERNKLSIKRLKKMIWPSSERSEKILPSDETPGDESSIFNDASLAGEEDGDPDPSPALTKPVLKEKRPGHGRYPASAYVGADHVHVAHEAHVAGDICPSCHEGKLYRFTTPGVILAFRGQAPIAATVYSLERFRCSACGELITALPPPEARKKWDESASASIAIMKYGHGMPFYRLSQLQQQQGIPLPPTTQWQIVEQLALIAEHVVNALWYLAAQAGLLYHDDTKARIHFLPTICLSEVDEVTPDKERKGMFTTGIVAMYQDHTIVLYKTGRRHAGENLDRLLANRDPSHGPPKVMCDALSANVPSNHKVLLCNCITHARRKFVDIVDVFPEQCTKVIKVLKDVYKNDALTKDLKLSAAQRLAYHQQHSKPLMDTLEKWMQRQLEDKLVEPNSGLGEAIKYMQRHWTALTMFLQVEDAPLDNNIVERALKMVVLHRKNAYFYRTSRGAWVGDIFMSIIATCSQAKANPMDYLIALQKNAAQVRASPEQWLPWNYQLAGKGNAA